MAQFFKPQKAKSRKNHVLTLSITGTDHEGAGIAKVDNKVCFVTGALKGESVQAKITHEQSKLIHAETTKVLTVSQERRNEPCQHARQCGGCQLQHTHNDNQVDMKQQGVLQQLQRTAHIDSVPLMPAVVGDEFHYRRSARIGVWRDKKTASVVVGFRRSNSKELINIKQCLVLAAEFEPLFEVFRETLTGLKCADVIGHLQLFAADNGNYVVIRHTAPIASHEQQVLLRAAQAHDWILISEPQSKQFEWFEADTARATKSIPIMVYQLDSENIADKSHNNGIEISIAFKPSDFIQVNAKINQRMVAQALAWLTLSKNDSVLDLFCGLGNFSLPLAQQVKNVVGIEGVEAMVEQAKANAKQNQIDNCEFYHADLSQPLNVKSKNKSNPWYSRQYNAILLDPARAGAQEVVKQISQFNSSRVLYVSCNPASFARDAKCMIEHGYKISKLGVVDMFPQTSHIETMALFTKQEKTSTNKSD
ncbi:23S rRNA (uracil(1939)-C(5))-methyltransferase RlmD [Flocculibacter collagenilyticus]|uniref:23S rRNA (uracil(1939)-C(5))-methyltransferase RlmD n=1 Tax=Flocculibacter collagenilyticus TaxID=2744479 RepID=UPI0018F4D37A|nr:23S rRNA (uracil(1939)-C(5))-methyltransferase RlmD [Flocculibacter collagenilyticus]